MRLGHAKDGLSSPAPQRPSDQAATGISGAPTKVKKVENVVLAGQNLKLYGMDDAGVRDLVMELVEERTFG